MKTMPRFYSNKVRSATDNDFKLPPGGKKALTCNITAKQAEGQ